MMKVFLKRIFWILSTVFFRSLDQPSCLTTAFIKTLTRVVSLCLCLCPMPESEGQKKLRLTKERLTNELRLRTVRRQSQLRKEAVDRLKVEEVKAEQCDKKASCLYACLFCFWLLVVNMLFAQRLYLQGRLRLN